MLHTTRMLLSRVVGYAGDTLLPRRAEKKPKGRAKVHRGGKTELNFKVRVVLEALREWKVAGRVGGRM